MKTDKIINKIELIESFSINKYFWSDQSVIPPLIVEGCEGDVGLQHEHCRFDPIFLPQLQIHIFFHSYKYITI